MGLKNSNCIINSHALTQVCTHTDTITQYEDYGARTRAQRHIKKKGWAISKSVCNIKVVNRWMNTELRRVDTAKKRSLQLGDCDMLYIFLLT